LRHLDTAAITSAVLPPWRSVKQNGGRRRAETAEADAAGGHRYIRCRGNIRVRTSGLGA